MDKKITDKQTLRQLVLSRRDGLDPRFRYDASVRAAEHGAKAIQAAKGAMVAGYWPIRSEMDPRSLLATLRADGCRLCLPVILDRETIGFREFLPDTTLVQTGFGTMGPDVSAPMVDPDIMLMPLAAFDRHGNRLGYGAGHYDRALARFDRRGVKPRLIGIAFDMQEVEQIPHEPHDIALQQILTESGLRSAEQG